ncbi:hypothetical protein SRHO_G00146720 [Serrasalmus rhombeus]
MQSSHVNRLSGSAVLAVRETIIVGSREGAGAYPSSHRAEGRTHPGQVASPSQGRQTDTDSHSHTQTQGQFSMSSRRHRENMQTPHREEVRMLQCWSNNDLLNLLAVLDVRRMGTINYDKSFDKTKK